MFRLFDRFDVEQKFFKVLRRGRCLCKIGLWPGLHGPKWAVRVCRYVFVAEFQILMIFSSSALRYHNKFERGSNLDPGLSLGMKLNSHNTNTVLVSGGFCCKVQAKICW